MESSFSTNDDTIYRLNGYIAGGNSAIFRCFLAESNEEFAVKFLRVLDPVRRERFEFECLVLNDLDHPNILPMYDVGLVETTFRSPIPFNRNRMPRRGQENSPNPSMVVIIRNKL